MTRRIAFYPGSFDPLTNGHWEVLQSVLAVADQVVVGIGVHPGKQPLFSFEERQALIEGVMLAGQPMWRARIAVTPFNALAVDAARQAGATIIVRGVRDSTDLNYEMQMAGMNSLMAPSIQTVFFPAHGSNRAITATLVRQIAKMGGDVSQFVPSLVADALKAKFAADEKRKPA